MNEVPETQLTQKIWKPFARQEDFLSIPDSIFEALYGGAAGGGKSECLLLFPIVRGFYQYSRFKGIIFRRTYPELEKEIILRSWEFYPPVGAKYSDEKKRWTFPSGAIMQFGHVEYESDVRKYDTTEYNYMAFDELTSFSEFQYLYLALSRCRSSSRDLPAIVRSGTNPGNIGHAWVRKRFIEAGPYESILVDPATKLKRIFIQSKATDNPHIDPGYINRLGALPEAEKRAKRDGDWWIFAGQVFEDYRELPLQSEPENACHVIEPFRIPDYWQRIMAVDWGFNAMTIALWGAISPDNRLYIYREYSCYQTRISTWASEIGRMTHAENEKLSDAVICQSAYQNRGDEMTIAEQFEAHSKLRIRHADNERVSGLLLMREYLRWKEKPKTKLYPDESYDNERATAILRKFGSQAYEDYVESFREQPPETNIPKLQIFRNCTELRKCIPLCIYDDNHKDDVASFDGDDPYDCCRYLVKSADRLLYAANSSEVKYQESKGKVVLEFDRNKDYNAFQRQLEYLERQKTVHSVKPFKRSLRRFA